MPTSTHHRAGVTATGFAATFVISGALLFAGCCTTRPGSGHVDHAKLAAAIADPARTPAFVKRDPARHPLEELTFFGVAPSMTVVELWPGGGYWTEILGPYLAAKGHYYVAVQTIGDVEDTAKWHERVAAQGAHYGTIHETKLGPGEYEIAPAGSADVVLTFRNLHNWMRSGFADQALAACYQALKPGGILGIEDHRAGNDAPQDKQAKSGYVRQDYTIALAEKAGFKFIGASEINANPKDTKNWPRGVWTLPPALAEGDKDRDKYLAIGEADNYVLKFQKPAS